MDEQEKREAYLMTRGWKYFDNELLWHEPVTQDYYLCDDAVSRQLFRDADVAIDAMLRLPALEERIAAVRQLWNSPAWCDPEMSAAMDALFAEVTLEQAKWMIFTTHDIAESVLRPGPDDAPEVELNSLKSMVRALNLRMQLFRGRKAQEETTAMWQELLAMCDPPEASNG